MRSNPSTCFIGSEATIIVQKCPGPFFDDFYAIAGEKTVRNINITTSNECTDELESYDLMLNR